METIGKTHGPTTNPFIKMPFQIGFPNYDPVLVLAEAMLAVELSEQPGQFVEIPVNVDTEGVDAILLAAVMDADAGHGVPPPIAAAAAAAAPAPAPPAAGQMDEGGPAHAPDVEEPSGLGDEWLDALMDCVPNRGEGHPTLNMHPEGLPPRAFNPPAFLQDPRYAPT